MDRERADPLIAAREVLVARHPVARVAWLCGSVLTAHRTAYSDLVLVVLLDGPPAPYRENPHHGGWPVELLEHTEDSWYAFVEWETAQRSSPLLTITAHGQLLNSRDGIGQRLHDQARRRWAAGPPPLREEELEDAR